MFRTSYLEIVQLIDSIDPVKYGQTRNYIDGAVTKLSPYISRGVISTKQIAKRILAKGYTPAEADSLLKELAWRDYFQQVWIAKGDDLQNDIKQEQQKVGNYSIPASIINYKTGIDAVDKAIYELYTTGYMHNHLRMYLASICCNIGQSHWYKPAQWMYYYLLDADWASNALSWQWVAGSFSAKKYYANQENINRFCHTSQSETFLYRSYEDLERINIPNQLSETQILDLQTKLPETKELKLDKRLPTYIYNFYNLDCKWDEDIIANRILLLEPSFFAKYPVCENTLNFIFQLAKNIKGIQLAVAEFETIFSAIDSEINFKEHPTNAHYRGIQHERDWMFKEVKGYFPSFFSYWRKCEK